MQAIGPAAAGHEATGKFVNDDNFAVFDHVLYVTVIQRMRLNCGLDVVLQRPVFWIGNVADPKQALDFFPAFVGDGDVAMLLIYDEIAGVGGRLAGSARSLHALFELGNDPVHAGIFVGGLFAGAGNNERRAGLVDQD